MSKTEKNINSDRAENYEVLKAQIEEQQLLIEKLINNQETNLNKNSDLEKEKNLIKMIKSNTESNKEYVTIELFQDNGKYKDDVTVAHNGKVYIIQRGIPIRVPKFIKEIIDNQKVQIGAATLISESLSAEFEEKIKRL